MVKPLLLVLFATATFARPAAACGVEGTAVYKDGTKVDHTATISSSWNGTVAFPSAGRYTLDLGPSACGSTLTVYINHNDGQRITLPSSGNAQANFVVR